LTVAAIKRTLKQLPKTLDETYARILANIHPDWQHYVYDILTLLAFSMRPLKLKEVVEAIAVDTDTGCFSEEEKLQDPLDIFRIASSLITLSGEGEGDVDPELRFAHFSVKEYLVSDRTAPSRYHITENRAHQLIAERCLLYLISNLDIPAISENDLPRFGFLEYSAEFWYQHTQKVTSIQDCNLLNDRMTQFFDKTARQCFSNWLRAWNPEWQEKWRRKPNLAEPLYYASFFGLIDPARTLLQLGADINAQGGCYGNALQAAAAWGSEMVVRSLLNSGADINAQGGDYGNALRAAAALGNEMMVRLLLDSGADINAQGGDYGSALRAAASLGNEMMVRLLLDSGADVNTQGGKYGNALQAAATMGHEMVVRLLLDSGADINAQSGYYGNALQAAAAGGHETVMRLLEERGATPH
jgi:hypothetical protein